MDGENDIENQKAGKVGYGKPPAHSRFQRGQSGNPKGRPKGTLNMATVLERTLRERVVVDQKGRRRTITKLEAALKQVSDKAASGDLKALQLLAALVRWAEDRETEQVIPDAAFSEPDEKVVAEILKRFEATSKGGQADETDE